jgi:hypothetical protein
MRWLWWVTALALGIIACKGAAPASQPAAELAALPKVCAVRAPAFENGGWSGPEWTCHPGGAWRQMRTWKDGELHGKSRAWYVNGQKAAERDYQNGKRQGTWLWWRESGQKDAQRSYREGKRHGAATWWHHNGQKMRAGTYSSGVSCGAWHAWDTAGTSVPGRGLEHLPSGECVQTPQGATCPPCPEPQR